MCVSALLVSGSVCIVYEKIGGMVKAMFGMPVLASAVVSEGPRGNCSCIWRDESAGCSDVLAFLRHSS